MGHYIRRSREAGGYGWSYAWAIDQRHLTEDYKRNYDLIDWSAGDSLGEPDGENRLCLRGKAKVWKFGPERFKSGE